MRYVGLYKVLFYNKLIPQSSISVSSSTSVPNPCSAPQVTPIDIPVLSLGILVEYSWEHCPERSKKQLLEGLLEHFFSPRVEVAYNEEDVFWFLKQLISDKTIFSRQPATIRRLKLYLTRILTVKCVSSDSSNLANPMQLFNAEVSIELSIDKLQHIL